MINRTYSGLLGVGLFLGVVLLYFPGIHGALYYDDFSNLKNLPDVGSLSSALEFIFGGHAGPLGRPIALLSFVPFASTWPENSEAILFFNILVHAVNFILLWVLGFKLIENVGLKASRKKVFYMSMIAALMWVVLPLLVSTSLIAIQRMTSLSSMFGLLGLLGFICSYNLKHISQYRGLTVQLFWLGMGTTLSVLTKESGAIFPVYALLIDIIVVKKIGKIRDASFIRRMVLLLPVCFILYYISPLNIDWFSQSSFRGFSPLQRLYTEAYVLWEYLCKAFIPQSPTSYGPFHDYYAVREFNLATFAAVSAWLVAMILAVLSFKRSIWIFFAVFWFLAGHLIESSTVMLEIYFEHRNYIAVYGLCLAFTVGAWTAPGKLSTILPAFQVVYIILLAAILFAMTNLWGSPNKAADIWASTHPGSARAALHAVLIETHQGQNTIASRGKTSNNDRFEFALKVLDRTKGVCPDCLDVRLQALLYSCTITNDADTKERFSEIFEMAPTGTINVSVVDQMFNISEILKTDSCAPLMYEDLIRLIDRFKPAGRMSESGYGGKLYFVRAIAAQESGLISEVYESLLKAEEVAPTALPILQYQVYYSIEQHDFELAEKAIHRRQNLLDKDEAGGIKQDDINLLREHLAASQMSSIEN